MATTATESPAAATAMTMTQAPPSPPPPPPPPPPQLTPPSSDLPPREAVAALSAALAFRRFEADEGAGGGVGAVGIGARSVSARAVGGAPSVHNAGHKGKGAINMGGLTHGLTAAVVSQDSGEGSLDESFEDSVARLSGLLRRRRPSLDTILSGAAGSLRGSFQGSHAGGPGASLRGSLRSSLDDAPYEASDGDEASLDSQELKDHGNDNDGELEGSMTVSLLEKRKLSPQYQHLEGTTASDSDDDENDNGTTGGNDSIDLEAEENTPAHQSGALKAPANAARKLVSSLHNSLHSSMQKMGGLRRASQESRRSSQESQSSQGQIRKMLQSSLVRRALEDQEQEILTAGEPQFLYVPKSSVGSTKRNNMDGSSRSSNPSNVGERMMSVDGAGEGVNGENNRYNDSNDGPVQMMTTSADGAVGRAPGVGGNLNNMKIHSNNNNINGGSKKTGNDKYNDSYGSLVRMMTTSVDGTAGRAAGVGGNLNSIILHNNHNALKINRGNTMGSNNYNSSYNSLGQNSVGNDRYNNSYHSLGRKRVRPRKGSADSNGDLNDSSTWRGGASNSRYNDSYGSNYSKQGLSHYKGHHGRGVVVNDSNGYGNNHGGQARPRATSADYGNESGLGHKRATSTDYHGHNNSHGSLGWMRAMGVADHGGKHRLRRSKDSHGSFDWRTKFELKKASYNELKKASYNDGHGSLGQTRRTSAGLDLRKGGYNDSYGSRGSLVRKRRMVGVPTKMSDGGNSDSCGSYAQGQGRMANASWGDTSHLSGCLKKPARLSSGGNSHGSYGGYGQGRHGTANASWGDTSQLSGCLRKPARPSDGGNSGVSPRGGQGKKAARVSWSLGVDDSETDREKKEGTRVSWHMDCDDRELEREIKVGNDGKGTTIGPRRLHVRHSSSLTSEGFGSAAVGDSPEKASVSPPGRPLAESLQSAQSEGVESLDIEAMLSAERCLHPEERRRSRSKRRESLRADEELLASMIQLANLENLEESSWGNHVSLLSGLAIDDSARSREGGDADVEAAKISKAEEEAAAFFAEAAAAAVRAAGTKPRGTPADAERGEGGGDAAAGDKDGVGDEVGEKAEETDDEEDAGEADAADCAERPEGDPEEGSSPVVASSDALPPASAAPSSSSPPSLSARRLSVSAQTVSRLAAQEVEDYRTRLQRKRASMASEYGQIDDGGTSGGVPPEGEDRELNELLLENATNISNAVLLQRALYTLRIHNDNRSSIIASRNSNDGVNEANEDEPSNLDSSGTMPRSHSEHTGLDRMALNHFLGLSSSGNAGSGGVGGFLTHATSSNPEPNNNDGGVSPRPSNPFSSFLASRRRNTYMEGSERTGASEPPRVGAYQSNEPAPLLNRRAFASAPDRRQRRAEARRNTILALERERRESVPMPSRGVSAGVLDNYLNGSDSSDCSDSEGYTPHRSLAESLGDSLEAERRQSEADETSATDSSPGSPLTSSLMNRRESSPDDDAFEENLNLCVVQGGREDNLGRGPPDAARDHAASNATSGGGRDMRSLLMASVYRNSFLNSKRLLQAVLVSDEIVEADHIETIHDGSFGGSMSSAHDEEALLPLRERVAVLEELLDEQDEERNLLEERFRKRERLWLVTLVAFGVIIVVLIVLLLVRWLAWDEEEW